jgi:hypothetical protein
MENIRVNRSSTQEELLKQKGRCWILMFCFQHVAAATFFCNQIQNYQIDIFCLSVIHATKRSKNKDWLPPS